MAGCERCDHMGWTRSPDQPGEPDFGRLYPCACTLRERAEKRRTAMLGRRKSDTFETYHARTTEQQKALAACVELVAGTQWCVFLHGPVGKGKTHLACGVVNALLEEGKPVQYHRTIDLFRSFRAGFSDHSYDALFLRVEQFEGTLVFDDLGTVRETAWVQETLYEIVDHRYFFSRPTLVTTNLPLTEVSERLQSRFGTGAVIQL